MKTDLPLDRATWVLPKKQDALTEAAEGLDLPVDLRRMSERQRVDLYNYLRDMPLQELKRRHDVIHSQQSELHQHLRYYGKNTSYDRANANLEIMDDLYRRVIEVVEEDYEEMLSTKYGLTNEPAWNYKAWGLPHADPNPNDFPKTAQGVVVGLENKYGVKFPSWAKDEEDDY